MKLFLLSQTRKILFLLSANGLERPGAAILTLHRSVYYIATPKPNLMQQEDDLRALEKVVQFMRGISILFVVLNIYWFCHG